MAMNDVVTSHLLVCLYSAAGKKAKRQGFYTRRAVTCTRCAVDRKDQTVTLQGGTDTISGNESFLGNELREGVFWTFGFPKLKRLFSRIKLVTKNDLAPRKGLLLGLCFVAEGLVGRSSFGWSCSYEMTEGSFSWSFRITNRLKSRMTF